MEGLFRMPEKRKRRMPIFSLLYKTWMIVEILHRLMFYDQQPIGCQEVALKNYLGNFRDLVEVVRRIGKNEVVLLGFHLEVLKNILLVGLYLFLPVLAGYIFQIVYAMNATVDRDHLRGAPGSEFHRYVTCAAKQVKYLNILKFNLILEDIE